MAKQRRSLKISPGVLWLTQTALISAVALVLSAFEAALPDLPVPLPGAKLGLSNIASMVAVDCMGLPSGLAVALIKALFAGVTRGATAFLMSVAGGVLSVILMYFFLSVKSNRFGYVGIGIMGAVTHNTAQLLTAACLTDFSVFTYLPVLLLAGLLAGTLTGLAMGVIMPAVKRIKLSNL